MYTLFTKIRLLVFCLAFSILVHFLFMSVMKMFGSYDFRAAVGQPQAVMVDLAQPAPAAVRSAPAVKQAVSGPDDAKEATDEEASVPARREERALEPELPKPKSEPKPVETPAPPVKESETVAAIRKAARADALDEAAKGAKAKDAAPIVSRFPAARYEKLTYAISMLGLSIGTAELESKNEAGVTTITLRMRSNATISAFFPVDDLIETNQIDGQFIVTKIVQQEGTFRSDEMFTINLAKKRVTWSDLMHGRSLKISVPTDDVLDSLSGIYSLRNHPLQIGKTETLHIFDSEIYAEVPVEVLRSEEMRLPNLTKVKTLVVRPLQKTAGIFRRTGELLIWMTDDEFKVPVRIETTVALGKIRAELVSAESKPHEAAIKAEAH